MSFNGLYLPYAAISNENAPANVIEQFKSIAIDMENRGYTMRTSGNKGVEEIIEVVAQNKEIYIPWKKFNDRESQYCKVDKSAIDLVGTLHPSFQDLKDSVKAIIGRYAHVILGKDLKSPVRCVVCWTEDGVESAKDKTAKTGYCGTPIQIASNARIPVFNLKNDNAIYRLKNFMEL